MKYFIYPAIALMLLLSSCSTKKYIYLNESEVESDTAFYAVSPINYFVKPGDILYISIHSTLTETEGMFHFPGQENSANMGNNRGGGSMYLNQSVIDEYGFVRIPTIGRIFLAGSTIEEVEETLELEARKYVNDALVRVKLVSYEISFIGEFNNPGKIIFYKDRIHILDALAAAGEVSYYGDRENIRVMRQTEDGILTYRIDLTNKDLMKDEKFFLLPNDVVYAEPTPRRIFRVNAADYSLVLATVTSTLAFITLMISLTN